MSCELHIDTILKFVFKAERHRECDNGLPATNNFRTKTSSTVDAKFTASQELLKIVKLPEKNGLFYMKFFCIYVIK
jgi:hypothetical protein